MGDVVITLVLEKYGLLPQDLQAHPAPVLVAVFDENTWREAMCLASELRRDGLKVTLYPEPVKIGKQFKYANRMGMRVVALIGAEEAAHGQVALKNMADGRQVTVPREKAAEKIREMLASKSGV
jgi:histidyl-tRNA synthetase